MKSTEPELMEKIASLAKRRGFIFPTAEAYGGLTGFWDWGPLGVELKNNIKQAWWKHFVQSRRDVVGLDSAIITTPKVWEASGHLKGFADELVECKKCHGRYRADGLAKNKSCPNCGGQDFIEGRQFNLMLKTSVGPVEDTSATAYLRPETAQNIFVNFENVAQSTRRKLPFGIGQIGKAFRNEITPGNFIFRSREFEQMELEFFVRPGEDEQWFSYWVEESKAWFLRLGLKAEHLREFVQPKGELAHYSKATTDLEYAWPFSSGSGGDKGWGELIGVANRGDYDLKAHRQTFKDEQGEITPYVIEPSFGVERSALAFLLDAYDEVSGGRTTTTESTKEAEVVLRLHKDLAPIKVAILPLSKKAPLLETADQVFSQLSPHLVCAYDDVASIGRRYRRQDEIGTPYCVTVDFETANDQAVTVRDRDTMEQIRVPMNELTEYLRDQFA